MVLRPWSCRVGTRGAVRRLDSPLQRPPARSVGFSPLSLGRVRIGRNRTAPGRRNRRASRRGQRRTRSRSEGVAAGAGRRAVAGRSDRADTGEVARRRRERRSRSSEPAGRLWRRSKGRSRRRRGRSAQVQGVERARVLGRRRRTSRRGEPKSAVRRLASSSLRECGSVPQAERRRSAAPRRPGRIKGMRRRALERFWRLFRRSRARFLKGARRSQPSCARGERGGSHVHFRGTRRLGPKGGCPIPNRGAALPKLRGGELRSPGPQGWANLGASFLAVFRSSRRGRGRPAKSFRS